MSFRLQKIVYNFAAPVTINFSQPAKSWTGGSVGIGAGMEWSAADVPSAWVTRRRRFMDIRMRFHESEWPDVLTFIEWAQGGGTFSWYPDADSATNYICYLGKPEPDEDIIPDRSDYPGDMEISIRIIRTTGAMIDVDFFPA